MPREETGSTGCGISAPLRDCTVALIAIAFALPYVPYAGVFGFVPLPPGLLAVLAVITGLYVLAAEILKRWFYRPSP
jgi:P-type Mg2+ transporter